MLEMAPELTDLPNDSTFDLRKFADSDEGLALTAWVQEQYSRAKTARSNKQLQWYMNMAFFFGKHHVERMNGRLSEGFRDKLVTPKKPYYQQRRTINRIRATVRSEISRFVSQTPTILGVPASADDEDVRAAYAAEQAWRAIENAQKLKTHFGRATWWTVVTGNGFIKDWWDKGSVDRSSGEKGAIKFAAVTPFTCSFRICASPRSRTSPSSSRPRSVRSPGATRCSRRSWRGACSSPRSARRTSSSTTAT
jgi:hypothetical protein